MEAIYFFLHSNYAICMQLEYFYIRLRDKRKDKKCKHV